MDRHQLADELTDLAERARNEDLTVYDIRLILDRLALRVRAMCSCPTSCCRVHGIHQDPHTNCLLR